MIYKLGGIQDMYKLPKVDSATYERLLGLCAVLTTSYGDERDIDNDDGGFVIYVEPGTPIEDVKDIFDYEAHTPECISNDEGICMISYILNNEYAVIIVMAREDIPKSILEELE